MGVCVSLYTEPQVSQEISVSVTQFVEVERVCFSNLEESLLISQRMCVCARVHIFVCEGIEPTPLSV